MLKFKFSLLLKSAKFKVAIVALLIATTLTGIILIPRNKAANMSDQVTIVANKSGVTAGGKNYYHIEKTGNATGYDVLFCIEQDASLSSKTYSSRVDLGDAEGYFESYNSAKWIINNMYTTNITGANGLSNDVAKNVAALNLANLLTSDTVKAKVTEIGLDTSSITAQKIFNLKDKTLNKKSGKNALEFAEQVALWKYTKNVGNTFTKAYADNVNQLLDGTTLTSDEQITLKYVLYAFRTLAEMNSGNASSSPVSNYVVLKKDSAKVDTTNYTVGPYYLESNGVRLTSYSFGDVSNGSYPATAVITKAGGSTYVAGTEVFVKKDDGSFYIDLSNHKDAQRVDFKISSVLSTFNTEAYVLEGGSKQNILTVYKSIESTSLEDGKTITVPGEYNVVMKKVKKDGTTVITSSEATFKVNGQEKTTTQGILDVAKGVKIANAGQVDSYEMTETKAPEGFVPFEGTLKLTVKFKQDGNKYIIDKENTSIEGMQGARIEVSEDNATISVYVPNEEKNGTYNVVLKKVKKDGTTVITSSEATFKINGQEQKTAKGVLNVAEGVTIKNENENPVYKIEETKAPEGFIPVSGTANLSVKFKLEGTTYVIDKDKTTFETTDGMKAAKMEISDNKSTITIYVPNEEKGGTYNVVLKKVKKDGTTVITSSEATFKINGQEQKTNEGVLNIAEGVTIKNENENPVYKIEETKAPEGFIPVSGTANLSVKFKLEGKTYVIDKDKTTFKTTDGMKAAKMEISDNKSTITIYVPNEEKEGKYNVVLEKIDKGDKTIITSSEATFKINGQEQKTNQGVLNIAEGKAIESEEQNDVYEIEETHAPDGYKLFEGVARLSVKFKLEGKKYVIDEEKTTLEGIEGADFEVSDDNATIEIHIPNDQEVGKYDVELYKTNNKGDIIKTPAKFEINEKEAITENGKIQVASNVSVRDEKTVGTYVIKETEAPENYTLYGKTLKLTVQMARVNGQLALTEDSVKLFVEERNGDESKFVLVSSDDSDKSQAKVVLDGTTVKIYVPNTEKEFDLSLRKYISTINGEKVEPSREPIINEKSIEILQQTGTAAYFHVKNSVGVKVGDEVEFTLRVYNEGEILGFAKQITDYLPEGLTFVKIADESSKEYTTQTQAGSKVVVIEYNGNKTIKTLRDFFGKKEFKVTSDYYQEVKIICKVEETPKTYITSRSEITNYGYTEKDEEGNVIWKEAKEVGNVDRDSAENNIKDKLELDTWYENAKEYTIKDESGKEIIISGFYPGSEDDDDFETVELLRGEYNVIIRKVDSKDHNKTLEGAYFKVKGSGIDKEYTVGPTGKNGEVSVISNVKINSDKQVDEYTLREEKAPFNYALYDADIVVKIPTKLENGVFAIDAKNVKVNQKDVDYILNGNETTITIIIPDDKKEFDLSLRKFITEVNGEKLTESREPQVDVSKLASGEAKTATYTHSKTPVDINTTDIVTYTIRVYNEGEVDGYASKIMDDIPEGLELVPAQYDQEGKPTNTNAQYKWVAYREMASGEVAIPENMISYNNKSYVVTDNVKEADLIVTDYLSKNNGEGNMLKAYDPNTMNELDYRDIKVDFKVIEPKTSDRIITNYAQITENTDSEGNSITDRDSTPNVWNDGEDDQDTEKVKVRYFDLALRKWVTKAIVYENGRATVTETKHTPYDDPEPVVKVDLKNTSINNVEVKFEYSIRIINEGQIAGYAKEISDYIPAGLKFVQEDNPQWKEVDGKIVTRALENRILQPGEYADVTVILTWVNGADNLGLKTNIAEISEDYNDWGTPDIDSTPNNQTFGEDDIDDAPVILAIRTGGPIVYTGIAVAVLGIVSIGAFAVKRKILR